MKPTFLIFFLLYAVMDAASAHAAMLSAADAQSLPDKELARRVLGEVGAAIVIAIDRPTWGPKPSLPALLPTERWPPKELPPLDKLVFYSRPHVTGSQFGLCGADVITVTFSRRELPRIQARERYGIAYPLEEWPESWGYEKSGAICAAATNVRSYFPAPDGQAAYEIARQFLIVAKGAPSGRPPFKVSCTLNSERCGSIIPVLAKLSVANIVAAAEEQCPPGIPDYPACYIVTVRDPPSPSANWKLTIVANFLGRTMTVKSVAAEPIITIY